MSTLPDRIRLTATFNWWSFIESWEEAFKKLSITLNRTFPNGIAAKQRRREAARAVHIAYRQKKGKRW